MRREGIPHHWPGVHPERSRAIGEHNRGDAYVEREEGLHGPPARTVRGGPLDKIDPRNPKIGVAIEEFVDVFQE